MTNWDDGYVTDVPYVTSFHNETTPIWMATAAALLGVAAPDLAGPFRYADLGCGNGATALVVAATMPRAEVWAFDFNPAHVESGRDVARRSGLTNVHFEEASFDDLASRPREALPTFDYIAAHGVLSWISLANRRRLFAVIGQRLAAGGIVTISYNVATGWTGVPPVRTLMRLLAEASPERTDTASKHIFGVLDKMRDAGAAMFKSHPSLHPRLAALREHDPSYVAHELLNRDWHPAMFTAVASAMAEIKCGYIGSATPQDNHIALTVPAELHDMFGRFRDVALRETVRDLACATGFRRDLYQRGPRRMSLTEQNARIGAINLVRTFKRMAEPIVIPSALGGFTIDQKLCLALLAALGTGPKTIEALHRHPSLADCPAAALLEMVTLLMGDGYLAPALSGPVGSTAMATAAGLNATHAALYDQGYDRPFLAFPALGGAWHADPLQVLALGELRGGQIAEEQPLTDAVLARVMRAGRQLRRKGKEVTDPAAARESVLERVRDMLQHQLPTLRRLGALDAAPEDLMTTGSIAITEAA